MMVATLLEDDLAGLRAAIRHALPLADAFEVRFDAFQAVPQPAEVRALTDRPLIATCRRPADGGTYQGEEHARLALLEAALDAGFDYVDLEGPTTLPRPDDRVIRSSHDFRTTPPVDDLVRRARELAARGAHPKIATQCTSLADALRILAAQRTLSHSGHGATLLGLGDVFPRALAHLVGTRFVYGGMRRNAPGQPSLRDVRGLLDHWGAPGPAQELYLVVGHPISHSLSPRLHNAAFRTLGLDAAYGALDVSGPEELRLLLDHAPALGLRGLSVTAPLKAAAYELCDATDDAARKARAVNCIRITPDGTPEGANTDGLGARRVLERLLGPTSDRPILIIGTGGAARGLLGSLEPQGIIVAGRDRRKLAAIENEYGVGTVALDQAGHYLPNYAALVNATPVDEPIRIDGFRGALFDLPYRTAATPWETHARAHNLPYAGGRDLLLEQAIPAFERWTGQVAPRDAMAAALEGPA
jgi:3-dehydroquinate dehydratase / shikimate dehydrogenase